MKACGNPFCCCKQVREDLAEARAEIEAMEKTRNELAQAADTWRQRYEALRKGEAQK